MINEAFVGMGKIQQIGRLWMSITQKLHGTNAQIYITKDRVVAGSRTRYLTPEDDNYGFAKWVLSREGELFDLLGPGRHFGEWCGPGINNGEGLTQKGLYLFNWARWKDKQLPQNVGVVPVLYTGKFDWNAIEDCMDRLKVTGSQLVPGYMKPEGVVVNVGEEHYKVVFDEEATSWKKNDRIKTKHVPLMDVSYLLQPLRLEKLFSRDERYRREFPENLPQIVADYVADLEAEAQFRETIEENVKMEKKALGKQVFRFVKEWVANNL